MRGIRHQCEKGAAAVEFALLVPVLVALLLGIVEFGRAYNVQSTISGAAREGVREYALHNDASAAEDAVRFFAASLDQGALTVTANPSCPPAGGDARTTVTVTYDFDFITGWFGNGLTLTGMGTMRCNG
ncbi:TadE/TadG family type IV pilus assembly protein [Georgenia muralis]|uniref:TadE/TadG family type IV pilus assembly protein n=1 Tax=Georgenia muralis TaxID=154117 RepID=UPI000F50C591|nr:TadE/TadG family type IV pilus assembly protein [Georgenia muralis]